MVPRLATAKASSICDDSRSVCAILSLGSPSISWHTASGSSTVWMVVYTTCSVGSSPRLERVRPRKKETIAPESTCPTLVCFSVQTPAAAHASTSAETFRTLRTELLELSVAACTAVQGRAAAKSTPAKTSRPIGFSILRALRVCGRKCCCDSAFCALRSRAKLPARTEPPLGGSGAMLACWEGPCAWRDTRRVLSKQVAAASKLHPTSRRSKGTASGIVSGPFAQRPQTKKCSPESNVVLYVLRTLCTRNAFDFADETAKSNLVFPRIHPRHPPPSFIVSTLHPPRTPASSVLERVALSALGGPPRSDASARAEVLPCSLPAPATAVQLASCCDERCAEAICADVCGSRGECGR
eukprot:1999672-Rhodomonas_salina.2